ncbi:MAG: DUF3786 domain-containing protein [Dehalococcoidia bacterium]|nr:DUF3786 domain-containing protein [Dehalococcoidia bacterium]
MAYEIALNKALDDFAKLSPYVAAAKSGTDFDGKNFRIRFFNRAFLLSHPEGNIQEAANPAPFPQWLRLVMLHYLIHSDGTAVADEWITYRQLPGALFFERRFFTMAINPLTKSFGEDIEGFRLGALALGGEVITRTGDAGFRFLALPRIPIACILYLGDEEVQSSVAIFFDAAASAYLPTEDLSLLGSYLNTLQRYKTPK